MVHTMNRGIANTCLSPATLKCSDTWGGIAGHLGLGVLCHANSASEIPGILRGSLGNLRR